jgi:hypothetical protein
VNGRYVSFTVRVWARGGEIVRGEVLHVPSGESLRFIDPRTVLRFLSQQIAGEGSWEDEGSTDLVELHGSADEAAKDALASEGGSTREDTGPGALARPNK